MKSVPRRFFKAKTHKPAHELAPDHGLHPDTILLAPTTTHNPDPDIVASSHTTHTTNTEVSHRPFPRLRNLAFFLIGFVLLSSLFGLGFYSYRDAHRKIALSPTIRESGEIVMGLRDGSSTGLHYDIKPADARADIVAGFLSRYKSPLKPYDHYGQILVTTADRYNLDYRLLPAIMMQESNLCKASDPAIHNCLGFGIHERGTLAFDSYEESFDRAARELKERYIDIGLTTPEEIMTKYTPSSNGSWANSVNQWIAEMEHNSREHGIASTTNADLTVYNRP